MDNLDRLIRALLLERGEKGDHLPQRMKEKRALLRTLMNVRKAAPLSPDML